MDNVNLAALAGIIISLVFNYVPGASDWYAKLDNKAKSLWMLAFLLIACLVLFGASCLGYSSEVTCTVDGAKGLLPVFVTAAIANQSTYLITKNI